MRRGKDEEKVTIQRKDIQISFLRQNLWGKCSSISKFSFFSLLFCRSKEQRKKNWFQWRKIMGRERRKRNFLNDFGICNWNFNSVCHLPSAHFLFSHISLSVCLARLSIFSSSHLSFLISSSTGLFNLPSFFFLSFFALLRLLPVRYHKPFCIFCLCALPILIILYVKSLNHLFAYINKKQCLKFFYFWFLTF